MEQDTQGTGRIIKFRAWNKAAGLWGYFTLEQAARGAIEPFFNDLDWATVGQLTDIEEKSGREIYEGDIVRGFAGEVGDVEMFDGAFVQNVYEDGELHHQNMHTEQDEWEVIGNIYENPELLK